MNQGAVALLRERGVELRPIDSASQIPAPSGSDEDAMDESVPNDTIVLAVSATEIIAFRFPAQPDREFEARIEWWRLRMPSGTLSGVWSEPTVATARRSDSRTGDLMGIHINWGLAAPGRRNLGFAPDSSVAYCITHRSSVEDVDPTLPEWIYGRRNTGSAEAFVLPDRERAYSVPRRIDANAPNGGPNGRAFIGLGRPVEDDRVILVACAGVRGALRLHAQRVLPGTCEYEWLCDRTAAVVFDPLASGVRRGSGMVDVRSRDEAIRFDNFSLYWSSNTNGKGWIRVSTDRDVFVSVTDATEFQVIDFTSPDLEFFRARGDDRWRFISSRR